VEYLESVRMKLRDKHFGYNEWYWDVFGVALIIGLNPITRFVNWSSWRFSPDAIAYVTMGTDLFNSGLLYIPSWGHVDAGVILPLLYPFLIALGSLFSGEYLTVAELVSSVCMLLSSVVTYLYLCRTTNRIVAVLTTLSIQVNYYFFFIGMVPLAESVFLLTLSVSLFLILTLSKGSYKNDLLSFVLGISSALVFFARQIGVVLLVFIALWRVSQLFIRNGGSRAKFLRGFMFLFIGFFSLALPYHMVLIHQTGQVLCKQTFRLGKYIVTAEDAQHLPALEKMHSSKNTTYQEVYVQRRLTRKLLPDSSEMVGSLYRGGEENILLKRFLCSFMNPKEYFPKVFNNINFLKEPLGLPVFYFFLILCISPFVVRSKRIDLSHRLLLPGFIAFYLVALSCFSDSVGRYVYVLFPLIVIYLASELFVVLMDAFYIKKKSVSAVCFGLFFVFVLYSTPRYFYDLKVYPKFTENRNQYRMCKEYIRHGEPAFGLLPISTYLTGATFRALPNDSLEKVVIYAKRTKVRWLVIDRTPVTLLERMLYNNAQWYWSRSIEEHYPDFVRCCCGSADGSIALYEIL